MMTAKQHIDKAAEIVNGDRQRDYGHPRDNHGCTAALWNAYLGRREWKTIDPVDVCVLNILQKLSRFANSRTDDTITDTIGYALNIAMCGEATDTTSASEPDARANTDTAKDSIVRAVGECEFCRVGKECPSKDKDGYLCTRQDGHDGDHVACAGEGFHAYRRWPNIATDTPANADAVPREVAEVRCFEWVGKEREQHTVLIVRVTPEGRTCIQKDGKSIEQSYTDIWWANDQTLWREFPPNEWPAKVAAVKAAAQTKETAK